MKWIKEKVDQLFSWYFNRSIWVKIIKGLILLITVTIAADLTFTYKKDGFELTIGRLISIPAGMTVFLIISCLILIGFAMYAHFYENKQKRILLAKTKIIAIEQRSLNVGNDARLEEVIAKKNPSIRIQTLFLDARNCYFNNSNLINPECAIKSIENLDRDLTSRIEGFNQKDVKVAYGGIASVPITFLTGFLLDDEFNIIMYDWDRNIKNWRELSNKDGEDFSPNVIQIDGFDSIRDSDFECILTLSSSYKVDHSSIIKQFPKLPKVDLHIEPINSINHWNESNQFKLQNSFLETVKKLDELGIKKIHLFIAAQNSMVFNLGRIYDKRNLPKIVVYQYEKSLDFKYPWGINMPINGVVDPRIEKSEIDN